VYAGCSSTWHLGGFDFGELLGVLAMTVSTGYVNTLSGFTTWHDFFKQRL
jgi:hypothetical protein